MNGVSFCLLPFKTRKRRRQLSAMASSSCRRKDDDRGPCFTSDTPHFFKIVLAHTLTERKLNVPKKFVRKHGKALLHNQVCLKVDGGAEWKVGLTKSNGDIWFQNGWQDFMKFYSVRLGYFLVFRYERDSCFHVIIFDHSASEIQYPLKNIKEYNNEEDGSDHQISDKKWSKRTRDKTQAAPCSLPNKKMKTNQTSTNKTVCNSRKMVEPSRPEGFNSKCPQYCSKREFKDNRSTSKTAKSYLRCVKTESNDLKVGDGSKALVIPIKSEHRWTKLPPLTATQKARVIEKANTFKSLTANPSFMVKMSPSYINPGKKMGIPRSFTEMHLKESTEVIVQVSDGRVWNIKCGVCESQNKKAAELRSGWKRFVHDNNLERDDICVFEMIESTKISLKVAIFRVREDAMKYLSLL